MGLHVCEHKIHKNEKKKKSIVYVFIVLKFTK